MKRVLVTGATGCVGRHALPVLTARGWEGHAVSSRKRPDLGGRAVVGHRADLLAREQVDALVGSVAADSLLHFAWNIVPGRWATAPENFAWVQASLDLVRAFGRHGGTRIVT